MMQSVVESMCKVAMRHAVRVIQERKTQAKPTCDDNIYMRSITWQRMHEERIIAIANTVIDNLTKE